MFSKIYDILGESLNVLDGRQNIIASNIANANTPGYRAKTLNFEDVMRSLVPSESPCP
jgi:Flagellar basal body protein